MFALAGHGGLKIEPLAKAVGKSKSSFYHHFADLELFVDFLLDYHIKQVHLMVQEEQQAQNIDPELIAILIQHCTDLLFNRQLRINQNIQSFSDTLIQSNRIVGDTFINVWVKDLSLQSSPQQIAGIFSLALENFFLQINMENLHYDWLSAYFTNLKNITRNFR